MENIHVLALEKYSKTERFETIDSNLLRLSQDIEKLKNNKPLLIKPSSNKSKMKKLMKFLDKYKEDIIENKEIYYIENQYFDETLFLRCMKVIFEMNALERTEYIYDVSCEDIDKEFKENNYCDFQEDKCILQRLGRVSHKDMGCCYTFEYSTFSGLPKDTGFCKLFDNNKKSCSTSCLTCKMFTCKYLKEKGIRFLEKDNFLMETFFNRKQKKIIEESFFKKREDVLTLLQTT